MEVCVPVATSAELQGGAGGYTKRGSRTRLGRAAHWMIGGSEPPLMCERAALVSKAALAVWGQRLGLMRPVNEGAVHPFFVPSHSIAPQPSRSITPPDETMSAPHSRDDEEFIDRCSRSQYLFLDTSWISIPALKSFLEARAGDTIMIASPAVPAHVKREPDASLVVDLTIKSEPVTASLPVRTRSQLEGGREVIELLSDSDNDEAPSPSTSAAGGITDQGNRVRHSYPELNSAQSDSTSESGQSSGFPNDSSSGDLSPESGSSNLDDLISDGLKKSTEISAKYAHKSRTTTRGKSRSPAAASDKIVGAVIIVKPLTSRLWKQHACKATHSDGRPCGGKPKLMLKKEGKSRGHFYWIACDGWTPHFKESHRTHSIPDNVDEGLLIKLFDDKPLADDDSADTNECSRIVHPHTGGHPHIIKGKAVAQCPIVHRACKCKRTYYVPVDRTIRKLLIFHPNGLPHSHPIPPPLKPGHNAKSKYRQCIQLHPSTASVQASMMPPSTTNGIYSEIGGAHVGAHALVTVTVP
ncbi:hypothetical protein DFH09DRAFT_1286743 [Mycena vulgaris]|nr:hypothetical protein DFH09DRAFT_1286743 [Mycena vulgaris]